MVRYLREYVVHNQDQLDIVIERLYSDRRLRKYDYVLDYFIDRTNNFGPKPENWINMFKSYLSLDNFDYRHLNKVNPSIRNLFACIYEDNYPDDYEETKWQYEKAQECYQDIVDTIFRVLNDDDTLQNDLFYSESGTEADLEDNDWNDISNLVKAIKKYTASYDSKFTNYEVELIKKHMKPVKFPLYRIEPCTEKSFYKSMNLTAGDVFSFSGGRTNGIKSFTSNLDSEAMKGMIDSRYSESKGEAIVIYETVGNTEAFGIDQISDYASKASDCEYEYFVSGDFEVTSVDELRWHEEDNPFGCDIVKVYIKQLNT